MKTIIVIFFSLFLLFLSGCESFAPRNIEDGASKAQDRERAKPAWESSLKQ